MLSAAKHLLFDREKRVLYSGRFCIPAFVQDDKRKLN